MIRVLVADDQPIVCEGLKVIIQLSATAEVVGIAHDGAQVLRQVAATQPDVILMDLKMPGMNGIQAMRALQISHPAIPVLVLTTYDEDEWVVDAIQAGAMGYLLKDCGGDVLIAAIEGTAAGRAHVDPQIAAKLLTFVRQRPPPRETLTAQLTDRERQIVRLLASGMTNAAIGERLGLAEGTIRNHISTIIAKLGATDRTQVVALAWRVGLVDDQTRGSL
ncbi:MAG: response regulator transcription factor [Ktedonobacterales bacterium]|nr:response regulator transcription factor [Ktedonobacterales bacterium]